ncbi:hypothetical protein [Pseudemcibacter aquimaris]|uniref:hypothetical protein n=1 Tax=Pseudemcibacter aquimaris TaxID=2857064 RepID=UPI002012E896|nr:hypothetical protein [Pseudemcibacter aquimaris]MCC3859877.1 hypothetical protein [Pseudemcibacter aquimaris]WDU57209.1 hypothetical protein KW060_08360 [Pseudemcibacter aquimaris]
MNKNMMLALLSVSLLSACGESTTTGPDLSGIDARDHNFFNTAYNRCNIGNTTFDCNCVARVNVEHRAEAYEKYAADFDTVHKPKMEADIEKMTATLAEKTMNRSDERVLEALSEDLHRLKVKLENGVDNIDDFELPFLPAGATDSCKITN